MPREFLRGWVCPIYGIGGIILYLIFIKLIKSKKINYFFKIIIVFVGTVIISSIIEYITSYILEYFVGSWPWQGYSNYFFNINGRISMPTSLKFGILGVVFLLFLYKFIEKFISFLKRKKLLNKFAFILLIIFMLDIVFAIYIPTNIKLNIVRESF